MRDDRRRGRRRRRGESGSIAFEPLAPRVLRRPDRVLRVLADLRPMGDGRPGHARRGARVLAERLRRIEAEPPARRYGRVFVASPSQARGRAFDVVFVPGAGRAACFRRSRRGSAAARRSRGARLDARRSKTRRDRAPTRELQLRLAVGAARARLYVSYPRLDVGEGRPRVPSFYALDVLARDDRPCPEREELAGGGARLATRRSPGRRRRIRRQAIDEQEHDLSTLRGLVD